MANRIDQRIASLERNATHMEDTYLMEWGQAVTDAELRAVAAMPVNLDICCANRGRTQPVSTMTDAQLYRIVKPAVDAMRESAHEQS